MTKYSLFVLGLAGAIGIGTYCFVPEERAAVPVASLSAGQETFLMPAQQIIREVNVNYQYCGPGYYGPVTFYGNNYSNGPRGVKFQSVRSAQLRTRLPLPARS